MKAKSGLAGLVLLASAFTLGACTESQRIEGIIERVGSQEGRSWGQAEARFIKLIGDEAVYPCKVYDNPACAILEPGDKVVIKTGFDQYLGSLEIISEASPTPSN